MIEVRARILQRSVFIPEETVQCELILKNTGSNERHTDDLCVPTVAFAGGSKNSTHALDSKDRPKVASADKAETVTLPWASAQIHCQCHVNEKKIKVPFISSFAQNHLSNNTSFVPALGEHGHCLCATPAQVLFCNLVLKVGQSQKFLYSQRLPQDFPPSYKGHHVKFSYKLSIGIGRMHQPLCIIRLPFRLFHLKGIYKSGAETRKEIGKLPMERDLEQQDESQRSKADLHSAPSSLLDQPPRSSPILVHQSSPLHQPASSYFVAMSPPKTSALPGVASLLDGEKRCRSSSGGDTDVCGSASFAADNRASSSSSLSFDRTSLSSLSCADSSLIPAMSAKLHNPFLRGEESELCSMLDLAMNALTSLTVKRNLNTYNIQGVSGIVGKFSVSKHHYRVGEDVLGTFDFEGATLPCVKFNVSLQQEEIISKSCLQHQPAKEHLSAFSIHSRYEECCKCTSRTSFLLPIPVTSSPEFTSKIVSVRWRLHFEFVIQLVPPSAGGSSSRAVDLSPPSTIRTEAMTWDLPIHVVATNPIQASLMMQADSSETVFL